MFEGKTFWDVQRENIEFQKSQAIHTLSHYNIEKAGGEGSRGGHVIGHTRSGKPVYSTGEHADNYSHEDHRDAVSFHKMLHEDYSGKQKEHERIGTGSAKHFADRAKFHGQLADLHAKTHDKMYADSQKPGLRLGTAGHI